MAGRNKSNKGEPQYIFSDLFSRGKLGYVEEEKNLKAYADAGEAQVQSYVVVRDVDLVATGTRTYNDAKKMVTGVADAHKIRHINMAGHMIKSIPLELTNAPPLLTLHLGYNLLQTINPRLFAMQLLQRINLDQNDLRELPSSIGSCATLKVLSAKNNKLTYLPATFSKLTALEELSLSYNEIKGFPVAWGNLVSLRCLWLSSNLIEYLPEDATVQLLDYDPLTGDRKSLESPGFGGLTSLEELWMESNRLEEIPAQFGRCKSLRYINFRRNMIEDVPREIAGLDKLENLVLTHNRFVEFPPPLFSLPVLHTLVIDHNGIRDMPKGLMAATALTCLNLSHNPIEAIPSEISLMTNLVQLYTSSGGKTPSTGQHLPGGWMRLHTMSSCFPVLDDDCITIHPPTSRPGTTATSSRMYPTHDRSNPDVIRPKTKGGLRFRPIDYWDGDIEGGSRPATIMAPGGKMPTKGQVKYATPPLSTSAPSAPYSASRPITRAGRNV